MHQRIAYLTLCAAISCANAAEFTTKIPQCKTVAKPVIPKTYLAKAKKDKRFSWALDAVPTDTAVAGSGVPRADENSLDWYQFLQVDLNNDGICDWYLTLLVPVSGGGDRDSVNALYLGSAEGWRRVGASIPSGEIDEAAVGQRGEERRKYVFGEEFGVLHEMVGNINYIIGSFPYTNSNHYIRPGYQIYVWSPQLQVLISQDKWITGSLAAQAYDYFKKHGAFAPGSKSVADSIVEFDPEVELDELNDVCTNTPGAEPLPEKLRSRCSASSSSK